MKQPPVFKTPRRQRILQTEAERAHWRYNLHALKAWRRARMYSALEITPLKRPNNEPAKAGEETP